MPSAILGSIVAILTISVIGLMVYYKYKDSQLQTNKEINLDKLAASTQGESIARREVCQGFAWYQNQAQPSQPTGAQIAEQLTLYRIESCNTGKWTMDAVKGQLSSREWLVYKPSSFSWSCNPTENGEWKVVKEPLDRNEVGKQYSVWIIKPNARRPWWRDLYLPDMRNTEVHYDTKDFVRTAIKDRLEITDYSLTDHLKKQGCFSIKKAETENYFSRYCQNGQAVCDFEERHITSASTKDEKSAAAWRLEPLCPGIESIVAPSWNRLSDADMPTTEASTDSLFRIESCSKRGYYIAYKPTNPSTWSCNPTLAEGEWKLVSIPDEDEVQYSVFIKKDSKIYLAIPSEGKYLDWEVTAGSKLQLFSGEIIPSLHTLFQTPTYADAYTTYTGNCKSFKRATNGGYIAYSSTDSLYDVLEDSQGNVAFPVRPSASWRFEEL